MEPRPTRAIDVMSVPEAGARLGMKPRMAYYAAQRGVFPVITMGRKRMVSIPAFERWLANAGTHVTWPVKDAG